MSDWVRDYAEKWGLPQPAADELAAALTMGCAPTLNAPLLSGNASLSPLGVRHAAPAHPGPDGLPQRYEDLGPIAAGAMGEVRRVWDFELNRSCAMKLVHSRLCHRDAVVLRFVAEAQTTAQLEHPGIVPIYDAGRLADGRAFFVMKEIRGRTLAEVIEEVHTASEQAWAVSPSGWTLRRLIEALRVVGEAVAYGHSRGVVHRDLKPDNIMVGAFGEVVLMDWGVARLIGSDGEDIYAGQAEGPVVTDRSRSGTFKTRDGSVAGTPAYMPPEQARGDHQRVGPWSDVYALGAVLYHILSDRPPFVDPDGHKVVEALIQGTRPRRPGRPGGPTLDSQLLRLCAQAMDPRIEARPMDATTFTESLSAWLEGSRQRDAALSRVAKADVLLRRINSGRAEATALEQRAQRELQATPSWAPASQKELAWSLLDRAREATEAVERDEVAYLQLLEGAMAHDPGLHEVHDRLIAFLQHDVDHAEAAGLSRLSASFEATIRAHDDGRHAAWLAGDGRLRLTTDPPGATVTVLRYERVGPRLLAKASEQPITHTPLDMALPRGSWLIRIRAPGRARVVYPVNIERQALWDGLAPGRTVPSPLRLPALHELPREACFVAPGWCCIGGDPESRDALPRQRVWLDGFVISRFPVTQAEFQDFLELSGASHRATLSDGPDYPVRGLSWQAAVAYAAWRAERDQLPWRLPQEREWEKAARGVDRRPYPWGTYYDGSFACTLDSHAGPLRPATVDSYPIDTSPYGVRGMAGNVRDWVWGADGSEAMVRGGFWSGLSQFARVALRYRGQGPHPGVGFRLVCSLH